MIDTSRWKKLVRLPATPEGDPDWDYMESYMKKIMDESENKVFLCQI